MESRLIGGVRGLTEVDLAEGAAADLPAEPELAADDAVHAPRRAAPRLRPSSRVPSPPDCLAATLQAGAGAVS